MVHDLLQESDLFVQSFKGGGFGLLSPLDFVHILSLTTEIVSHILLVVSLTRGATHLGVLLLSIFSAILPLLVTWCNFSQSQPEPEYNVSEAQAAQRHERMRSLAYSDIHRPEIALFGLGDWILKSWSSARKIVLSSKQPSLLRDSSLISQLNLSDFMFALQNVRLFFPTYGHLLTCLCTTIQCLDTPRSTNANIFRVLGILDVISQLRSIRDFCVWEPRHNNENGFPEHFSDVCVLCMHEVETSVTTGRSGGGALYRVARRRKH